MSEQGNRTRVEIRHLGWAGFVALEGDVDGSSELLSGWDYQLGELVGMAIGALTYNDDFNLYNFAAAFAYAQRKYDGGLLQRLIDAAADFMVDEHEIEEATQLLRKFADKRRAKKESDDAQARLIEPE